MAGEIPEGRPPAGTEAPTLRTIHVRVDEETLRILSALEAESPGPKRGRRSVVVRAAIHEAGKRLKKSNPE